MQRKQQLGKRILRHAYFNSFFQTGLKNLMDKAILFTRQRTGAGISEVPRLPQDRHQIPFHFTRRRMSVVVEDKQGKRQIITKGALEEIWKSVLMPNMTKKFAP